MAETHPSGSDEQVRARALLERMHRQVRATIARIDAGLTEFRERERLLADEAFRAGIRAETQVWFKAHPDAPAIAELFGESENE